MPSRFMLWYQANREVRLAQNAVYRSQNRDRIRARDRAYSASKRSEQSEVRRVARYAAALNMRFVSFDGEGSRGKYQLLGCSATDRVVTGEQGLGTLDCLDYFANLYGEGTITKNDAIIGFGLGYDFENMLRDVSDEDYNALRDGKMVEFESYRLRYVSRKFLDFGWDTKNGNASLRLSDIYPYFQTSFIKACASRGIELPPIVYTGKRQRGTFRYRDIATIIEYNREELVAMVKLANALREEFVEAFRAVDITPAIGPKAWYGPGSQAISVLGSIDTGQVTVDSTRLSIAVLTTYAESYGRPVKSAASRRAYLSCSQHPFTAAYFGGRIEAAMQGRFDGKLLDYDLTSAYPYALTRLPVIAGAGLLETSRVDTLDRIGVYLIRWESDRAYNPFPYRARTGNVYFPPKGYGWVLSPELYAGIDGGARVHVERGFVIDGSDGFGRGDREGTSELARLILRMGEHRAIAKREGNPAHRGLKLLMNSVYGKTLQKEGSRRYFNAFLAAWITSVTRSKIYRLVGPTEPGDVISVMTDGVLSTKPLPAALGNELGDWTVTEFDGGYQFAPGVYLLYCADKSESCKTCEGRGFVVHYRGFLKFDHVKAAEALDSGRPYLTANNVFVSRVMAQHDKSLRNKRYQFAPVKRREVFSLDSKRNMQEPTVMDSARYYPAKDSLENIARVSYPYDAYGSGALGDDDVE